jgi:nitrite reductase (cytochrome c-552)
MTKKAARWRLIAILVAAIAASAALTALLVNIFEKKQEARNPFFRVVDLDDSTVDPEVWGKNFPHQYDGYRRTVDQVRTRYGGSEAVPRQPTQADPRSVVAQSRLAEDPRLKIMWAGYAFSHDFREERGHAYMLDDQRYTERQSFAKQPGTCLNCHASTHALYKRLGNGDTLAGFDAMNRMSYAEATKQVEHPVACIDCHDSQTMQLRLTRPAFVAAIKRLKAKQGVADYDPMRDASRQELRSFVCGQCHVEYYFKGEGKTLTYPWDRGMRADEILEYYEAEGFTDWTHGQTGARVLKAQHPEFGMFNQGTHARAGVSCADCHMPYKRVGSFKVSDHHVRSPLLNLSNACQSCHRASEQELEDRVLTIQTRTYGMRNRSLDALVALIRDIERAKKDGADDQRLAPARRRQMRAQFFVDFVEAENSMGFHADQEAMRVLAMSLDESRLGQLLIRDPAYVDVETAPGDGGAGDAGAPDATP